MICLPGWIRCLFDLFGLQQLFRSKVHDSYRIDLVAIAFQVSGFHNLDVHGAFTGFYQKVVVCWLRWLHGSIAHHWRLLLLCFSDFLNGR